jgi:hypothetical protein
MSYPKIDKYDCDHCMQRNVNHGTDACVNINEVTMSKSDFHMYQKALKDIEWVKIKLEDQLKLLNETSFMYKFCKKLLDRLI